MIRNVMQLLASMFHRLTGKADCVCVSVCVLYFLALGYCIAVGKFMLELKVIFPDEERGDILNQNHLHLLAELKRHNSKCSSQVKVLDMLSNSIHPFPDTCSVYRIVNYIPAATQGALHVRDGDHVPLASKLVKFLENVETVTILLPDSLEVLKYSRTLKILYCHIDDSMITGILNETINYYDILYLFGIFGS